MAMMADSPAQTFREGDETKMTPLERANQYQNEHRIEKEEKPVFHVTPPVGWMNDPNGFSVYQGKIHLFYQYHPYSEVWGPMHWGHCVSDDFIDWKELPVALAPDQEYDAAGCFSGSAIETADGHALVYTGVKETKKEDGTKETLQQQCLAIGDGLCYNKVKENPVISGKQLPDGFSKEDFRDPKIWKEGERYYLVAGSRNEQGNGQVVLFTSENLTDWRYVSVLADNQGRYGTMWECPDFFQMGDKHVLLVSPMDMQADGKEFHNGSQSIAVIGTYDRKNFRLEYEQVVLLDYGTDFYATQTLQTEEGRRIMIAWMQSWDMLIKPAGQKWNGMMTVPRELELRDGVLYQNPVRELEKYRTAPVLCSNREISGTCVIPGVEGRVLDLTLEILGGDFERFSIQFAKDETHFTQVCYQRASGMIEYDRTYCGMTRDVVCQRSIPIKKPEKTLKLRLILDVFSAELFINDGAQAFSSIYFTPPSAKDIVFTCDGTALVNIEKYGIALN